jgi:hypothetical protein
MDAPRALVLSSKRFAPNETRFFCCLRTTRISLVGANKEGVDRCQQSLLGNVGGERSRFASLAGPDGKGATATIDADVQRVVPQFRVIRAHK